MFESILRSFLSRLGSILVSLFGPDWISFWGNFLVPLGIRFGVTFRLRLGSIMGSYPVPFGIRKWSESDTQVDHIPSQVDQEMMQDAPPDPLECAAYLPKWVKTPRTLGDRRVGHFGIHSGTEMSKSDTQVYHFRSWVDQDMMQTTTPAPLECAAYVPKWVNAAHSRGSRSVW